MSTKKEVTVSELVEEGLEYVGHSFSVGCICGAMYYFTQGAYLGVRGKRIMTGFLHCRDRTTYFAGSVAMWSMVFNISKGTVHYIRQKDDRYTFAAGGALTGFLTHVRASM